MPLPLLSTSPQHCWMCRPSKERTEWPFSVERMWLYGVHCKCSHIDLKCQESWAHAHTPHTLLTCLPLVAVMAVFCCVVLRDVALAEAARTSSRKKAVPLPTAVTCSISLSLLHVDPNSVSGREVSAFYRAPPSLHCTPDFL